MISLCLCSYILIVQIDQCYRYSYGQLHRRCCLSVILSSLSSLLLTPAYVEAWNIYQKLGIVVDPLLDGFLIYDNTGQVGKTVLCLKNNITKLSGIYVLVAHIFTKISQNICMSYQYTHFDISTCQTWPQVMECHFILLRFLSIFIYYHWPFLSELLYLLQTFTDYVFNQ